jgi:hypothetical protein
MNHAQRISLTLRYCSRAGAAALASLFVALSAYGASSPSSPGKSGASVAESTTPSNGGLPCR